MEPIAFQLFKQFPEIIILTSTRVDGDMLEGGYFSHSRVSQFVSKYVQDIDIKVMGQVHGNNVEVVSDKSKNKVSNTDGMLTRDNKVLIGIITADCLPIIFYDPKERIIGVAHAGYKGILAGIIDNIIETFEKLGSKPENIYVGIGPAIGVCCYEIKEDVASLFRKKFPEFKNMIQEINGKLFLDLKITARQILLSHGTLENNIDILPICTKDSIADFFSYRGDTKETFGEFATVIGML
jgi:polyphenol oxidase